MALAIPGLREFTIVRKVSGFFKKLLTSPWFYVILAFLAIGAGTFFYLRHDKNEAVESARIEAVEQADTRATIQSYEAQAETQKRTRDIDKEYQEKRDRTTKDYANARNSIQTAPVEERDAPASPLIVDTLNELDRMYGDRESDRVHHPEPPVG